MADDVVGEAEMLTAAAGVAQIMSTHFAPFGQLSDRHYARVEALREAGLGHDADLLGAHAPCWVGEIVCASLHDDTGDMLWPCGAALLLWPGVEAAMEEMREAFRRADAQARQAPKPGGERG